MQESLSLIEAEILCAAKIADLRGRRRSLIPSRNRTSQIRAVRTARQLALKF